MRELKFRAWIKRYQKYMPVSLINFDAISGKIVSIEVVATGGDWCKFYPEEFILEQYTGLKDKNGKEIYEGDIVEGSWLCGKDKHIVKYEDYGFYPFTVTDFDGDPMIRNVDIEVIGNIHENPELLEDKE